MIVLVFAGAILALVGLTWTRVARAGAERPDDGAPADAIVVFGAQVGPRGPSPELQARLEHAVALWRSRPDAMLLCSGGRTGPLSEARVMREAAVRLGVPRDRIVIDEGGCSTRRTIAAARRHSGNRGGRVLLASSPYHMHRIASEARRQGLDAIACPTPPTPVSRRRSTALRQTLREVAAVWWYALARPLPQRR